MARRAQCSIKITSDVSTCARCHSQYDVSTKRSDGGVCGDALQVHRLLADVQRCIGENMFPGNWQLGGRPV